MVQEGQALRHVQQRNKHLDLSAGRTRKLTISMLTFVKRRLRLLLYIGEGRVLGWHQYCEPLEMERWVSFVTWRISCALLMSFPVLQSACSICAGVPVSFMLSKPCNQVLDLSISHNNWDLFYVQSRNK